MNDSSKQRAVMVPREYLLSFKNPATALLLAQIRYWYLVNRKTGKAKLKLRKWDLETCTFHYWIGKSYREWLDEIGLTRSRLDGALATLEKAGIIETQTFMFNGSPTTHVRLVAANGKAAISSDLNLLIYPGSPFADIASAFADSASAFAESDNSITGYYSGEYPEEDEEGVLAHATPIKKESEGKKTEEESKPEEEAAMPKIGDSTKDILAKLKADKVKKKGAPPSPGVPGFIETWREGLVDCYPDKFKMVKPFTTVERAKVKQLVTLWEDPQVAPLLKVVIPKWVDFVKYCEMVAGAYKTPLYPNFEFLFRYRMEAYNFWDERVSASKAKLQKPVKEKTATIPLDAQSTIADNCIGEVDPDDAPVTLEYMKALYAELHPEEQEK